MRHYSNRELANLFVKDQDTFCSWQRAINAAVFMDAPHSSVIAHTMCKIRERKESGMMRPLRENRNASQRRKDKR